MADTDRVLQRKATLTSHKRSSGAWGFHPAKGIISYDENMMVEGFDMNSQLRAGVVLQSDSKKNFVRHSQHILKNDHTYRTGDNSEDDMDNPFHRGTTVTGKESDARIEIHVGSDLDDGDRICAWAVIKPRDDNSKFKIGTRKDRHFTKWGFDGKDIDTGSGSRQTEKWNGEWGFESWRNGWKMVWASWDHMSSGDGGKITFNYGTDTWKIAHIQVERGYRPGNPIKTAGGRERVSKDKTDIKASEINDLHEGYMVFDLVNYHRNPTGHTTQHILNTSGKNAGSATTLCYTWKDHTLRAKSEDSDDLYYSENEFRRNTLIITWREGRIKYSSKEKGYIQDTSSFGGWDVTSDNIGIVTRGMNAHIRLMRYGGDYLSDQAMKDILAGFEKGWNEEDAY